MWISLAGIQYNDDVKSAKIEVSGATNLKALFSGCDKMDYVDLTNLE